MNLALRLLMSGGAGGGGASIMESAVHWYDLSSNDNLTLTSTSIDSATDLGSTGANITSTSTDRPTNTATINGIQAGAFTTADFLRNTSGLNSAFDADLAPMTIAIAFSLNATPGSFANIMSLCDNGANQPYLSILARNATTSFSVRMRDSGLTDVYAQAATWDTATPHVLIFVLRSDDTADVWFDGTKTVDNQSMATAGTRTYDMIALGGLIQGTGSVSVTANVNIGEVAIFDSALDESDVSSVIDHFSRWLP